MDKPQRNDSVPVENILGEMTMQFGLQDDLSDKSAALDRERLEVAWLRQDIIDEYVKKSAELLKHLDSMESVFDHQRSENEKRETKLKRENEELRHELAHGCRAYVAELLEKKQGRELERAQHVVQAVQVLKSSMKERIAQKEYMKELRGEVEDLLLTLEKKEEEHKIFKGREEIARRHIEEENDELRRKASLGWLLGCLSELYMRLDPDVGTVGIMKLVRKVKRELESGNCVFRTGGELPDDQRKKLRLNKCFWEHEAKYHREQAEAPKRSVSVPLQVPSKKEAAASEPCVLKDHPKQKHLASCHLGFQKLGPGLWAEVRLLESVDQAAKSTKQTSCNSIKKILYGLESGMSYLLSQERLRSSQN
ncbi:uncharacterized protein [Physcomitrium patens]|uniref:Uncharacterized protein n=1 Tax=Physcomitrium patens TaxID=3218 RepID=A0A7I4DGS4_PHYPA|nr:uncharacterized protein LOC112280689 isoform X2 [Physcomitrium patens]|eukprot:XP_024372260.1 uncharacterized protein LOC112280689 isoform X2 [Physcomitrella patens]